MKILQILFILLLETISLFWVISWSYADWPFRPSSIWQLWLGYVLLHSLAVSGFVWCLNKWLPKHHRIPRYSAKVTLVTLTWLMPMVGMIGVGLMFYAVVRFPKAQDNRVWRRASKPELPNEPVFQPEQQFGVGGLKDILLHHPSPERRLAAVNACRYIQAREALPLLRIAVTDKEDDVRLLAYALIENIEAGVNQRIADLMKRLQRKETDELHLKIGQLYWELFYLDLSDGPLALNYLNAAKRHFSASLQQRTTANGLLKLGRVYLALRDLEAAKATFERAEAMGAVRATVALYLAEIAFEQQRYDAVRLLLCQAESADHEQLEQLKGHWCRAS